MDILFWSGGKDAYLSLLFYRQKHPGAELKLLTTFEQDNKIVPYQNIPVASIKAQAEALNLNLKLVSLPKDCPNDIYMQLITKALRGLDAPVEHLLFGDWRSHDIRTWREEQFSLHGYTCRFPIWEKSVHKLLPALLFQPVEVRISAVQNEFKKWIRVGELYNQAFVQTLPDEIDPMGENGEFHTEVVFKMPGK